MTLLMEMEYENGRGYAVQLLDPEEADPPQDIIRLEVDGEPLIDLTMGELADLATLLSMAVGKYFKALVEGLPSQ